MIPSIGSRGPDECQQVGPNFSIKVWNGTAARGFMEEHYDWMLSPYNGYKHPIQAFEYFLLWHYGGVYRNLDISCRRCLLPLLRSASWFPKAQPFGVNSDLMAAHKHQPFIGDMTGILSECDENLLFPHASIYWRTGPQFTSDAIKGWWLDGKACHIEGAAKSEWPPELFFAEMSSRSSLFSLQTST